MKTLVIATQSLKDRRCFNRFSPQYSIEWIQAFQAFQDELPPSTQAIFISIDHPIAGSELISAIRQLREKNQGTPICLTSHQNDAMPSQIPYIIELIKAGATDFLELPCAVEEVDLLIERFCTTSPKLISDDPAHQLTENPTLLVIDDNIQQSHDIMCILPPQFTGFHAPTVNQGLDIVQNQIIDFILLDIALPDLLGNHAISLFQSFSPASKIIMISAYKSIELIVETIQAGAIDYLPKPIRIRHLSSRLAHHMKKAKCPK